MFILYTSGVKDLYCIVGCCPCVLFFILSLCKGQIHINHNPKSLSVGWSLEWAYTRYLLRGNACSLMQICVFHKSCTKFSTLNETNI